MKSSISFLLLVLNVVYIESWQPLYRCDYTYHREVDAFLKLHEMPVDYRTARLKCSLEGAEMAVPLSPTLYNVIKNIASVLEPRQIFMGVHSMFSSGDFQTNDGTSYRMVNRKWAKGQPDNKRGSENCLIMGHDGEFEDVSCEAQYSFMCYKKRDKNMRMTQCGTYDKEYMLGPGSSSCYKFHPEARTWSQGSMVCTAEGGHLAIITGTQDAQFIVNLINQHHNYDNSTTSAAVGMMFEDDQWKTVHDQPITDIGYTIFAQPDADTDVTPSETLECGGVNTLGELVSVNCKEKLPFVCQKHPKSLICDARNKLQH